MSREIRKLAPLLKLAGTNNDLIVSRYITGMVRHAAPLDVRISYNTARPDLRAGGQWRLYNVEKQ